MVPDLFLQKILAKFVFLKICAANKNRLFLPFLSSGWIPPMCFQTGKGGSVPRNVKLESCINSWPQWQDSLEKVFTMDTVDFFA